MTEQPQIIVVLNEHHYHHLEVVTLYMTTLLGHCRTINVNAFSSLLISWNFSSDFNALLPVKPWGQGFSHTSDQSLPDPASDRATAEPSQVPVKQQWLLVNTNPSSCELLLPQQPATAGERNMYNTHSSISRNFLTVVLQLKILNNIYTVYTFSRLWQFAEYYLKYYTFF